MRPERHPQEAARLEALRAYEILDTPPEKEFEDLVALASRLCETPVALVTLLDEDRQWFKAAVGVDIPERPYEESLCSHAILQEEMTEVPDLTRDPRFADNAVVAGEPHLRFYAGVPLESREGLPVGTLCVIDVRPRELTDLQREALRVLGRQVVTQMELRRRVAEGEAERRAVQETLARAEIGTWYRTRSPDRVHTNPTFRRLFNLPDRGGDELSLTEVMRAIHPDDRARVRDAAGAAAEDGTPYELEYRVTDARGRERWVLARGNRVEGTDALSGIVIDVSEKMRAREALVSAEERFRAVQETTPDAFTILEATRDEAGTIVDFRWVYLNPATERLTGESNASLLGASFLEKRPGTRETGHFDAFVAVADTGEPTTREFPVVYRGDERFLRLTAVRVGDGVAVSFNDVTDRRRAEETLRKAVEARTKELREAVEEAERFNYSISHDLRTPLRAIAATSQVLIEEAGPELSESHRELLERQSHNARRLGLLIDQLLRLSRLGRVEVVRTPLDMTAIARSVAEEIGQAGDSACSIEVLEGMRGEGDPALVRLVYANLVGNACKFSCGKGAVRVFQEGEAFVVSDEGRGFDMRYAPKIFQPFERLVRDDEFAGTGIGLANVERIVRRHGGRVWAESAPGQGATFRFTLG